MTRETYRKAEVLMNTIIALEQELDRFEHDKRGCSNSLPLNTHYIQPDLRSDINDIVVRYMKRRLNEFEKAFNSLK